MPRIGNFGIFGISAFAALSYTFLFYVLSPLLRNANILVAKKAKGFFAVDQFQSYGLWIVGIAVLLGIIWWLLGTFVFTKRKVLLWWLFVLFIATGSVVTSFAVIDLTIPFIKRSWILAAYLFNSVVLMFWGSTVLFSPDTFRYDPLFADKVRGNW